MRNAKMVVCLGVVAACVGVPGLGVAADNCGGYHVNVGATHVNFSDNPTLSAHLAVGTDVDAHSVQMKDKDGDEYTYVFTDLSADADRIGTWMIVSGTGKYVKAKWSGWWKRAREDRNAYISVWGGNCK
jgi:hypothetical protein